MSTIRRPNPPLPDSIFAMFSMRDKVAIITGGAGGIGYQVARGLAEAGANVALWYNTSTQAEQLADSIAKEFGVKAKAYQCNVQDFNKVCFFSRSNQAGSHLLIRLGPIRTRCRAGRLRSSGCDDRERRDPVQGWWLGRPDRGLAPCRGRRLLRGILLCSCGG